MTETKPINTRVFWDELLARDPSLHGSPLSVSEDGTFGNMDQLTAGQQTAVEETYAAHDAEHADLVIYAADARWRAETTPGWVGDMHILMDRVSQERMASIDEALAGSQAPGNAVAFKALNGFYELDQSTMREVRKAITEHIQQCFRTEKETVALIDDGSITTKEEVDAQFAPIVAAFTRSPVAKPARKSNERGRKGRQQRR